MEAFNLRMRFVQFQNCPIKRWELASTLCPQLCVVSDSSPSIVFLCYDNSVGTEWMHSVNGTQLEQ